MCGKIMMQNVIVRYIEKWLKLFNLNIGEDKNEGN